MLIGICADIHNELDNWKKALEIFKQEKVSLILCCGDWGWDKDCSDTCSIKPDRKINTKLFDVILEPKYNPKCNIISIYGNHDESFKDKINNHIKQNNIKNIKFIERDFPIPNCDSKRIAIVHKKECINLLDKANTFDLICYGHSHNSDPQEDTAHIEPGQSLIYNPGSVCKKHENCEYCREGSETIAIYNTQKNKIKLVPIKKSEKFWRRFMPKWPN